MRNTVIALTLLLTACAGTSTVERVTLACNGYSATLKALTAYEVAGELSNIQGANIDRIEPILTAACLGDPENITSGLLNTVEKYMLELIAIQGSVK